MEHFPKPDNLSEWVRQANTAWEPVRTEVAVRHAYDMCYYEGLQWVQRTGTFPHFGLQRLRTDYNPDSRSLRVVSNMTTTHAVKVAAATFPSALYVDVLPPRGDGGIEEASRAQACEDALNAMIDASGYLAARRHANFMRVITGTWGVGLCARPVGVRLRFGAEQVPATGTYLHAFAFDPMRLTLDPARSDRALHDHDFVIYSDAWTADRVRRVYGITIPERDLRPLGELAHYENTIARISEGRAYAHYQRYSQTPGVIVRQVHIRDEAAGRFGRMYVGLDTGGGEMRWLNFENPESPFGGNGLPLALYHGHSRPDSVFSIGDVAMLRDSQDRRNLLASVIYRHIQRYAGFQIVYDKRTIPRGVSEDDAQRALSNTIGGIISVDMGTRNDNRLQPSILQYPAPQPVMLDMMERTQQEMRDHTFRSEANFGVTKSHVPDTSVQRLLEESDQVIGIRIQEDLSSDDHLLTNLLGTVARGVQRSDPGVLAPLGRAGLGAAQFAGLLATDPDGPGVEVKVRESSVRYRSHESRKQDMMDAVRVGALPPDHLRRAMAAEADRPLVEADREMARNIRDAVVRIVRGEEWTPYSLGEYAGWFVNECQRAMLGRGTDQAARERLTRAVFAQRQMAVTEEMAAQPPQPQQAPPQEQAEPQPTTLGELLGQIEAA